MIRPIILDTDPGVGIPGTDADDAIALYLALSHPDVELRAVTTTFGNCPPALTARGAGAILAAVGRTDIPIGVGEDRPLAGRLDPILETAYRGDRGRHGRIPLPELAVVDSGIPAARLIRQTVRAQPGEVTIVAIGPQTNIAQAFLDDPELAGMTREVVFMGGALWREPRFGHGNVTPVAECNMYFDPEAADIVFRSGVPLRMVGLDVTNPATGLLLDASDIAALPGGFPAADLLREICATYLAAPMFVHGEGCVLYDPLAVLAAVDPHVVAWQELRVAVETAAGADRGRTVERAGGSLLSAMVDVNGRRAVEDMIRVITSEGALR